MRVAVFAVLLSVGCALTAGCGISDPQDPEAQIKAVIAVAEEAAQQRDIGTLRDLVAAGYHDRRGYEKRSVVRLAQGYMLRHRNIHLFSKVTDFEGIAPGRATTSLLVAMAGRHIESVEQLWDVRADVFRFDLTWIQSNGDWQVVDADWWRVRVDDFFPD